MAPSDDILAVRFARRQLAFFVPHCLPQGCRMANIRVGVIDNDCMAKVADVCTSDVF